jgi:hypothetical protein
MTRLQCDYAVVAQRLQRFERLCAALAKVCHATAHRLQIDGNTVTKVMRSYCDAIPKVMRRCCHATAHRLQIDFKVIAMLFLQRLRRECDTTALSLRNDCKVIIKRYGGIAMLL